jgi:thymidylate synthase
MNEDEQKYLNLLKHILENGSIRKDRTGVGTIGIFGTQLRFSLENNIVPMLTTKKMFSRGIIEELLFFIRGEINTKKLEEKGINIWKGNTTREFLDGRGLKDLPDGSMGKSYSFQYRNFGGEIIDDKYIDGVDQISEALNLIKTDPNSRRILVSAWNPKQLKEMALPPCHYSYQMYVDNGKLSLQWNQRSVDTFLGLGFNILSYAILARLFAAAANLEVGELIFVGGDTHIYLNHINQVKQQMARDPFPFPTMKINKKIQTVEDMENLVFEDFLFENYQYHPAIKGEVAI